MDSPHGLVAGPGLIIPAATELLPGPDQLYMYVALLLHRTVAGTTTLAAHRQAVADEM